MKSENDNAIEVEVLSPEEKTAPKKLDKRWYHPLSAVCMIALDFGGTLGDLHGFSFLLLMPLVVLGIFTVSALVVANIQLRIEGEDKKTALLKGAIAGLLCAIPLPIFGTAAGSALLIQSGLQGSKKGS